MSDYKSRLAPPARGMGAGLVENQRAVGAADPERAAALAGMSADQARQVAEAQEARLAEMVRKRQELLEAIDDAEWSPEGVDGDARATVSASMDPSQVDAWHTELVAWRQREPEADSPQVAMFGIGADDPLYQPLRDVRRRRALEAQCEPLDFASMVLKGYADQVIPVRPGLDVVFRTPATQHSLWLELKLGEIDRGATNQYGSHWFSLLNVAASLVRINDVSFSPDLSSLVTPAQKNDFMQALDARMERLSAMPEVLTNELIIQYTWFAGRLRKLMQGDVAGKVGN